MVKDPAVTKYTTIDLRTEFLRSTFQSKNGMLKKDCCRSIMVSKGRDTGHYHLRSEKLQVKTPES